ncbi:MAG TPA: hypothetical protein VG826_19215 [Pirellulales bacterium]|nr:hypothetical protein [Pirellulales bacterium]
MDLSCRSRLIALFLSAAIVATAPPAHAALMTETISGEPVTVDTSTGLVWLDASKNARPVAE